MKKFFAIIALVAFVGVISHAQTTSTDKQAPAKQEVKKCTEAEKAKCDKVAAKTGAKCETHDMKASTDAKAAVNATDAPDVTGTKTEKSCDKAKAGSSCSKGTTSAGGSCCQKGGAKAEAKAAPTKDKKKSKGNTVAVVTEKK